MKDPEERVRLLESEIERRLYEELGRILAGGHAEALGI